MAESRVENLVTKVFLLAFLMTSTLELAASSSCDSQVAKYSNASNAVWCTSVLNSLVDYLIRSRMLRDGIQSSLKEQEAMDKEAIASMGFQIAKLRLEGAENLRRAGDFLLTVKPDGWSVMEGSIAAVDLKVTVSVSAMMMTTVPVRLHIRGLVVAFGVAFPLESGRAPMLTKLRMPDLGKIDVDCSNSVCKIVRRLVGNRLSRSRIAKSLSTAMGDAIAKQVKQVTMP